MPFFKPYEPADEPSTTPPPTDMASPAGGALPGAPKVADGTVSPDGSHARDASGRELVHTHKSRCPNCLISVTTIGTPPPTVCPYCQRALDQSEEWHPLAEAIEPPSHDEVERRKKQIYHRPYYIIAGLIGLAAIFILSWAVLEQLKSFADFWYKGFMIATYSVVAGLFVITRFLFAAFYHAPPMKEDFEPTLTVLVPCFNEGEAIRKTIERIFSSGYPEEKLEVVCVNDGSKDDSLAHMLAAQTRHPHLIVVDFEKNRGLCHGWGVATFLARGEFMVCVDSDTFVFPGSLKKLMQGFLDPTVGGISGHCDIENADVNTLTRLQDVRYYFSYKIMKAAESVFGVVSCLPGCFSAYRRTCVLAVMDKWINATVMGEHGNFADDRSLTNQILRNYKIIYDDEALATTICPEKWKQYIRQQARWERSYLREIWKTGKFIWRKHPVPALSWYAMMWMPLIEPLVMLQALVVLPVKAYLQAPDAYRAQLHDWTAAKNAVSQAGGFLSAIGEKLDYSIVKALVSPWVGIAIALWFATLWAYYRRSTVEARQKARQEAEEARKKAAAKKAEKKKEEGDEGVHVMAIVLLAIGRGFAAIFRAVGAVVEFIGECVERGGPAIAVYCALFFLWQLFLAFQDIPLIFEAVDQEFLHALFFSATFWGVMAIIGATASCFIGPQSKLRKYYCLALSFALVVFIAWQTALAVPPNLEQANISMNIYSFTKAITIPRTFLIGVMAITAVWSLHFLATTGRNWWKAGFAFTLSYILFFSWQIYWALYTIRGKAWGTRG